MLTLSQKFRSHTCGMNLGTWKAENCETVQLECRKQKTDGTAENPNILDINGWPTRRMSNLRIQPVWKNAHATEDLWYWDSDSVWDWVWDRGSQLGDRLESDFVSISIWSWIWSNPPPAHSPMVNTFFFYMFHLPFFMPSFFGCCWFQFYLLLVMGTSKNKSKKYLLYDIANTISKG